MSNTGEIIAGAQQQDLQRIYFRNKAPYFPDYYTENEPYGKDNRIYYYTCIVRHKHEGLWYRRHHLYSIISDDFEKGLKHFLRQVYLDIKFGEINPGLTDMGGRILDPIDTIQESEEKRFSL